MGYALSACMEYTLFMLGNCDPHAYIYTQEHIHAYTQTHRMQRVSRMRQKCLKCWSRYSWFRHSLIIEHVWSPFWETEKFKLSWNLVYYQYVWSIFYYQHFWSLVINMFEVLLSICLKYILSSTCLKCCYQYVWSIFYHQHVWSVVINMFKVSVWECCGYDLAAQGQHKQMRMKLHHSILLYAFAWSVRFISTCGL
jgi:hypothetical protein